MRWKSKERSGEGNPKVIGPLATSQIGCRTTHRDENASAPWTLSGPKVS